MSSVQQITKDEQLQEIQQGSGGCINVVLFWSPEESAASQHAKDLMDILASSDESIKFWSVDVTALPTIATMHLIESVPFFKVFSRSGECLLKTGNLQQLTASIESLDMNKRLEALISQAPFMVFIKGSPDAPRCGFTRQLVNLLQEQRIAFDYFDILQDEDVRQALKEYSRWPTYPQIYVRGELLGGLDIFKDMIATNQLCDLNVPRLD